MKKRLDKPTQNNIITISCGAVAQLGERVNGIHEVVGSIPISSTREAHLQNVGEKGLFPF